MREYNILVTLGSSREEYEGVVSHVKESLLSPEGRQVLDHIKEFYDRDADAPHVDWDIVKASVLSKYEQVPKHKQQFEDYFTSLAAASNTSIPNLVAEVKELIRLDIEMKLADAITARDRKRVNTLMANLTEFQTVEGLDSDVEEEYTGLEVNEIVRMFDDSNRIRVAPAALNERLAGGCRRGHHLLLCARPEVGKSMFALSMTAQFARDGHKVLYIGNEDPIIDLIMRLISSLIGLTEEQILRDPEDAMKQAKMEGYDNVTFVGMAPGSIESISNAANKHKPDVLVIDQLRNLSAGSENNTTRLDQVARGARDIGRKHNCLVVSVTQAGDSAEGKLNLSMGDVDSSNTGIPGACDVMVMVGCNDEYYDNNLRRITLAKNKVGRSHASFTVRAKPHVSSVTSDPKIQSPEVIE